MPKRSENSLPTPKKARNSLVAYVDGKRIVFGNYDDPVAWQKFNCFCEERQSGRSKSPPPATPSVSPSGEHPPSRILGTPHGTPGNSPLVADLVAEFLDYAAEKKDRSDFCKYKIAGEGLLRYATVPTAEFDVYLLLQLQDGFVKADYARTHCNKLVNFCIQIFRWGENRRLVPKGKRRELQAIEPVQYGQARETEDREPVDDAIVEQTLAQNKLLPVYESIMRIIQSTGARPIELFRMRIADIDRSDPEIWVYRPRHHKTKRHNKRRILAFGEKEQKALLPYLDKAPKAIVFSPLDEVRERVERGEKVKRTKANTAEQFDTRAVCKELKRAIKEANRELPPDKQIPYWTMYQLRHSYLTDMVEQHGENDAALVGGHSDPKMIRGVYDHSQQRRIVQLKRLQEKRENTRTKGLTEVVQNLDLLGLPSADIALATRLSLSEVEAILQKK